MTERPAHRIYVGLFDRDWYLGWCSCDWRGRWRTKRGTAETDANEHANNVRAAGGSPVMDDDDEALLDPASPVKPARKHVR